jgi:bis(5'-nucleosidyl)-tetraphosphatase
MKIEKSCGSIIIFDNKVLLIEQISGDIGFPKGHTELNETEVNTAIRETKEETNLDIIVNENQKFPISYVIKNNVLKQVIYFLAIPINEINLKPQETEIKKAFWVDINEVEDYLTFDNLKKLWLQAKKEILKNNVK